ncbi:hypothetical protein [Wolbachia endosymbiont of Kerria lacca]
MFRKCENIRFLVIPVSAPVIQVANTGMALLHHSRKEQAVTDGICYKIDI